MNEHELHRLLDDAATAFEPTPSHGRLALALAKPQSSGRRLYAVLGIAAGLTALAAGAAAMTGEQTAIRTPADQGFEVDVSIDGNTVIERVTPTTAPNERTAPTTAPTTKRDEALDDKRARIAAMTDAVFVATELEPAVAPKVDLLRLDESTASAHTEAEPPKSEPPPEPPKHDPPREEPAPKHEPAPEPPKHEPPPTTKPPTTEPPHDPPPTTPPTTAPSHEPPTTEPPHEEEPPPTTSATVGFSAQQLWGSCESDPPYDEFKGTATPGTVIDVSSPYGSGQTEADGHGKWYVKVIFGEAPVGEPFEVGVSSSDGDYAGFTFVRTG